MTEKRRVIVTQNDSAGKSSVLEDRQIELYGVGVFNFWQTLPDRPPDDVSGRGPAFKFFPAPCGTQFRLFTIPPADPSVTPDQIKAIADEKEITVAVKTGKVSVFSERASPTLLLTCNQQATFERSQAKFVRSALKSPVLLNIPIENQEFTYSEAPATAVFDALAKAYGVNMVFDRNSLAHCSITATLGDEPLENKLKWLCTILEAKYTITEDSITITGNPCN